MGGSIGLPRKRPEDVKSQNVPERPIRFYVVKTGDTVAVWPAREDQIADLLAKRGGEVVISYGTERDAEDARQQLLRSD